MIHPFVDQKDRDDEIRDGEPQEHIEAEEALLQTPPFGLSAGCLKSLRSSSIGCPPGVPTWAGGDGPNTPPRGWRAVGYRSAASWRMRTPAVTAVMSRARRPVRTR